MLAAVGAVAAVADLDMGTRRTLRCAALPVRCSVPLRRCDGLYTPARFCACVQRRGVSCVRAVVAIAFLTTTRFATLSICFSLHDALVFFVRWRLRGASSFSAAVIASAEAEDEDDDEEEALPLPV